MQDIFETFEFDKIKELLLEYTKTDLAKEFVNNLKMFSSREELISSLQDLNEIVSLYQRFGPLPIKSSGNALYLIDLAKKSGLLTPRDLHLIALDVLTIVEINKYLKKVDVSYPRIKNLASKFYDLSTLEKSIHFAINSALVVDDRASSKLKDIRKQIKKLENELNQKGASLSITYGDYLTSDNPTIRDGHFVLPVKTAYKGKVFGIVYDVSDSGNTTFIEPMEIVSINNKITALKVEENEEVRRILKELTNLVLLQEGEIISNNRIIATLDFLQAKCLYGLEINGVISSISKTPCIDLTLARHPLIDKDKVVANSYHLDDNERIIIISGPNAGGKTVSLKTVGLLVLMNQAGLMISCEKAKLSYFKNILIDIGDNQSLSDNLSTFSAHMKQIGEIVSLMGGNDLILLDELGTGTDPNEGEALALSVTKLIEKKHSLAMISSHFSKLKEYGFTSKVAINSSMIFDEENLRPTYVFKQGVAGKSYALEVANRFNLPTEIISYARELLKKENNASSDELMAILHSKVEENLRLESDLKKLENELNKRSKILEREELLLKQRKENLLSETKIEKERLILKAKEEIQNIIQALSSGNLKLHEVIELKKKVEAMEEDQNTVIYNEDIKVGDYVSIPSLMVEGTVKRINGKKAQVLTNSSFSVEVDISKLHKIEKPVSTVKVVRGGHFEERPFVSVPLELNIIGLRVDEALDKLAKYLDSCRVKNHKTVRIIHGFGSGALRKATREYLDKQKDLSYRSGDASEGGSGATVVTFNDR